MKVCLAGHFGDALDEGVRNVGKCLAAGLERKGVEIEKLAISSFFGWRSIRRFRPDVIHFVLSPTSRGIIAAKLFSNLYPSAKTVISAVHPSVARSRLLMMVKPDLILVQAEESDRLFKSIGFETRFLPNGVDIAKFKPINQEHRQRLRDKFKVPEQSFLVLHLASMTRDRNLDVFKKIQEQEGIQVVIIGREKEIVDKRVLLALREAGCLIWIKHFPSIEEIYNLSDCYVFPTTTKTACIETPLSILEAMACNLPIVTTKFGALPAMFSDGSGLLFADADNIQQALLQIKNKKPAVKTREKVLPYSWDNVAEELVTTYEELLC